MTSMGAQRSAAASDPGPGPTAPPEPGGVRISSTVWAALAVVYVVWGSTYLGIRIAVETMPALLSGAVRFLVAGLLLFGVLAWRLGPGALRVTRRRLGSTVLVGVLLLVGGNGLLVLAEGRIPSGLAALLVAVVPLWVVLLRTVFGDRPGERRWSGYCSAWSGWGCCRQPGSAAACR